MRWKRFRILVVLVLTFVTPLLATQGKQAPSPQIIGIVESWNETERLFTIADDSGKRWILTWNEGTMFLSRPSVGDRIKVAYATDPEGSVRALRIGKADKPNRR